MYKIYTKKQGIPKGCIHKILFIMRLTTVLLIATMMQVSAASYGQRITLNTKNATLLEVFKEIRVQSGYDFMFDRQLIANANLVSISVNDASLEDVLKRCFETQSFTYTIEDKTIVIRTKNKSMLDNLVRYFASITVTGTLLDEKGMPLPGASVKVKGTNQYTSTNKSGVFILSNVDENAVIVISFIGYEPMELKAKGSIGTVILKMANSKLDDVQIIAYGTTTRRLNTGNIGTLKAEDIEKQPVNNALTALTGRVAGMFVTQGSGLPNSTVKVQIRGTNSISQGVEPLYVIDGVPYAANLLSNVGSSGAGEASPFSFINPSSIESIDVLKDADATAIYGSRGANGVILITTKKGKPGNTKFDVNLYTGISRTPAKADLLDRDQYLAMRNEAFKNTGIVKTISNAPDLLLWDTTRNENWQKRLLGHSSINSDAQVSMSGGSDYSSYRAFIGYNRTTPPFPGDFKSDKISGGISVSTSSVNKRFNAQISLNYLVDKTFLPSYNPVSGILLAPVAPEPINPDGTINYQNYSTNNPFPGFLTTYTGKATNLVTNANLSYAIFKTLLFKVNAGYNNNMVNGNYRYTVASQIGNPFISSPSPTSSFSYNNINAWVIEPQLSYQGTIGRGKLEALLGNTLQTNNTNGQLLYGSGYSNDAQLPSLAAATTVVNGGSTLEQSKFISVYGRLNYNLHDKYLLNLTGRRDGSSRFGPDKKFGNFGAAGAAWIFSKEKFMADNLSFLSFGKLRASYGITGNEPGSNYQYLQLYDYYNTIVAPRGYQANALSLLPNNIYSPDFAWEQVSKLEGGLELGLLKDRVLLSASYFTNRSSNQLVAYQLPSITGSVAVLLNRPATVQNTGFEFTATVKNIQKANFSWTSNLNITISRNKLKSFPGLETSSYADQLIIGQPLNIVFLYRAAGVNPQTGIYQFYDKNGNLTSTPSYSDKTEYQSTNPKFFGGFQNSFTYKSFSLDVFLQFVNQMGVNYYYVNSNAPGRSYYGDGNQPVAVLDRWQKPGDIKPFQQFTSSSASAASNAYSYQQNSDAGYTDASYIRLKNVSLNYKLPRTLLSKLNIDQTRIYFQAQNLFTLTKYKGLDPEGQGITPPLSIWTMGAQFTF